VKNSRIVNKKIRKASEGFTLVELTVAMVVLTVGVLGGMLMIIVGATRDNSNRVDTTATNVAQTVLEQISGAPPNANPILVLTDCVQTSQATSNLKINTAPGGAQLWPNGDINFGADTAAALNANNYQMNYTVCGNNGLQTVYDVRWTIQTVGAGGWGKLVIVSARQPFSYSQTGTGFIRPVTLRTVVSM
jgi:prepilin-type N-terminal cleavage/methylation domain-containing protein